jgi:hypothetical protein
VVGDIGEVEDVCSLSVVAGEELHSLRVLVLMPESDTGSGCFGLEKPRANNNLRFIPCFVFFGRLGFLTGETIVIRKKK